MTSSWFIELKFNGAERFFHQYRVQNNLVNLPANLNAKIEPQQIALVDNFIIDFEKEVYEKFDPANSEEEERTYLIKMKKYFCEKCSFLNDLIKCYAANLTDNEVQIYFYRKMIRLINELTDEKRVMQKSKTISLY